MPVLAPCGRDGGASAAAPVASARSGLSAAGWSRSLELVPDSASLLAARASLCSSDSASDVQSDRSELLSVWLTRARGAPVGTLIGEPWLGAPGDGEAALAFLLLRIGLLVLSGLPLGALGSAAPGWATLLGFFAAGDLVLLFAAAATFSLEAAALRLELRLGCAKGRAPGCCCLLSLGDFGAMAGGLLEERECASLRKGLAGDGARFTRFFSSWWFCGLVSLPEPLELSILHRQRPRRLDGGKNDQSAILPPRQATPEKQVGFSGFLPPLGEGSHPAPAYMPPRSAGGHRALSAPKSPWRKRCNIKGEHRDGRDDGQGCICSRGASWRKRPSLVTSPLPPPRTPSPSSGGAWMGSGLPRCPVPPSPRPYLT